MNKSSPLKSGFFSKHQSSKSHPPESTVRRFLCCPVGLYSNTTSFHLPQPAIPFNLRPTMFLTMSPADLLPSFCLAKNLNGSSWSAASYCAPLKPFTGSEPKPLRKSFSQAAASMRWMNNKKAWISMPTILKLRW